MKIEIQFDRRALESMLDFDGMNITDVRMEDDNVFFDVESDVLSDDFSEENTYSASYEVVEHIPGFVFMGLSEVVEED